MLSLQAIQPRSDVDLARFTHSDDKEVMSMGEVRKMEAFYIKHCGMWRNVLNAQRGLGFIRVKKTLYKDMPRSIEVGVQTDYNGVPVYGLDGQFLMRVMVLYKRKVLLKDEDVPTKGSEVGKGRYKVAKASRDWISGKEFVQILSYGTPTQVDFSEIEVDAEFAAARQLRGRPGTVDPLFMRRRFFKVIPATENSPAYTALVNSYFVTKYQDNLLNIIELMDAPFSCEETKSIFQDFADALVSYQESRMVHIDGKIDNTMRRKDGKFIFYDNALSLSVDHYLARLKDGVDGAAYFFAPELFNFSSSENDVEIRQFPYARDMWSSGVQLLAILIIHRDTTDLWGKFVDSFLHLKEQFQEAIKILQDEITDWKKVDEACKKFLDEAKESDASIQFSFLETFKAVSENRKLFDMKHLDKEIDSLFEKIRMQMNQSLTGESLERFMQLLSINRKMLLAKPADRIDSMTFKREVYALK